MRSRVTMAGSRFPGSRVTAFDHLPRDPNGLQWFSGRRLSAYSCGGSRGIARRDGRTAFPWRVLADTTDHETGTCFGMRQYRECLRRNAPAKCVFPDKKRFYSITMLAVTYFPGLDLLSLRRLMGIRR